MARPMMLPVFSRSVNNPTAHGTIINNVHQPSKKMSMFVTFNALDFLEPPRLALNNGGNNILVSATLKEPPPC